MKEAVTSTTKEDKIRKNKLALYFIFLWSGAITILGEYTQRNLDFYWMIKDELGKNFANVILGQLGDIGGSIAIGSAVGLLWLLIGKKDKDRVDLEAGVIAVVLMNLFSLIYILLEIGLFKNTNSSLIDCKNPAAFCYGEFRDILAFSVSIITTLIFLISLFKKHKNTT